MEKNLSGNSPHRTAITIYKYKVYMTSSRSDESFTDIFLKKTL